MCFGGSSGGGGLMLGTSATVPNPYASATDLETGFLYRRCRKKSM